MMTRLVAMHIQSDDAVAGDVFVGFDMGIIKLKDKQ
jgi:hypothetical protein